MSSLFTRRKAGPADLNTVTLSLISHTNVGKTTLARTLLRRDVGDALDQPHVTDIAEAWQVLEKDGYKLLLWDTPGFGDTARLLKRLKISDKPVRWMLGQLWDRLRDRPLWCSQQAVRNVQEEADVVLYLVNAGEGPGSAGYVPMEMEILGWIGKPVILLLNQTGQPRSAVEEEMEETEWRFAMEKFPVVRAVLGMDAFARCWVQEDQLMATVIPLLDAEKRAAAEGLRTAWRGRNLDVFQRSMRTLGRSLAESVLDKAHVSKERLLQKIGIGRGQLNDEMEEARGQLTERLAQRSLSATNDLIILHGLEGRSARDIGKVNEEAFGVPERVNESLWTAMGGLLTGAAGGVIADIKTGGMSFGSGTVLGMICGGAGTYLVARGYNLTRGDDTSVRWTAEHFAAQTEMALLCYLAVAHYGRGRGDWQDAEHPPHWRQAVKNIVATHRKELDALWKRGAEKEVNADILSGTAEAISASCARALLRQLYPKTEIFSGE